MVGVDALAEPFLKGSVSFGPLYYSNEQNL